MPSTVSIWMIVFRELFHASRRPRTFPQRGGGLRRNDGADRMLAIVEHAVVASVAPCFGVKNLSIARRVIKAGLPFVAIDAHCGGSMLDPVLRRREPRAAGIVVNPDRRGVLVARRLGVLRPLGFPL